MTVLWFGVCDLLVIFRCTPIRGSWIPAAYNQPGVCIDYGDLIFGYEITNLFDDLLIIALPMWQLRSLQMRLSKKIGLGIIFSLGALSVLPSF